MTARRISFAALVLILSPALHASEAPAVLPGPDVLVSRDGRVPHVELSAAVSPKDPKNVIGSAITLVRNGVGSTTRAYASFDGGATWRSAERWARSRATRGTKT